MSQVAIVVGSLAGVALVIAGIKYLKNKSDAQPEAKYQYTNTGMPDEGLTDYNDGYNPRFGVGGKKNKTKRKKQSNQSKKNK